MLITPWAVISDFWLTPSQKDVCYGHGWNTDSAVIRLSEFKHQHYYHNRQCSKPWRVARDQPTQQQAIFNLVFTESRAKKENMCLIQGLLSCSPLPPLPAPTQMLIAHWIPTLYSSHAKSQESPQTHLTLYEFIFCTQLFHPPPYLERSAPVKECEIGVELCVKPF